MSAVKITKDAEGKEIQLDELNIPIEDDMCKLFVDLHSS
jgi:hypothetical protein